MLCEVFEGRLSFSMGGKQCGKEKQDSYLLDLGLEQKHPGSQIILWRTEPLLYRVELVCHPAFGFGFVSM